MTTKELEQCLVVAILNENIEMVRLSIYLGADINKKDKDGWNALTYAKKTNNIKIINLLKKAGATE